MVGVKPEHHAMMAHNSTSGQTCHRALDSESGVEKLNLAIQERRGSRRLLPVAQKGFVATRQLRVFIRIESFGAAADAC